MWMASKLKEQREPGQQKERPEEHKQHTEIRAEVGLTRLEETSLEGWVIVIEMLGHIREMDVHFKYSDHSFLAC